MNKNRLLFLISEENWTALVDAISVEQIPLLLGFRDSMTLGYDLFFKNTFNDNIQNFAIELFFLIRKEFEIEWSKDWKNDAFLGKLCSITWKYDEMYQLFKSSYDQLENPPESLLLLLASCNSAPGVPPINDEESEKYLLDALETKITYESASMMKDLMKEKGDREQEILWGNIATEMEFKNIHTELIIPDILAEQNRY